jgi:hypothetical protein
MIADFRQLRIRRCDKLQRFFNNQDKNSGCTRAQLSILQLRVNKYWVFATDVFDTHSPRKGKIRKDTCDSEGKITDLTIQRD